MNQLKQWALFSLAFFQFGLMAYGQSCSDPAACNYDPSSGGPSDVCLDIETIVHTGGALDGLTTYKLYFQGSDSSDFVTAVYGNEDDPLSLTTTTEFYQHPLGGASAEAINPLLLGGFPELEFDSYVTIGLDRKAVPADGENSASLIASPNQNWISTFEPGSGAPGSDIIIDDAVGGLWFIYNGDVNGAAGTDQKVLLAQLTTDGVIAGTIHVQYFPQGGAAATVTFSLDALCEPDGNNDSCTYPEEFLDCSGNCLNDADTDLICDEVDDCVGTVDALGVCNGDCAADEDEDGICDDNDDCVGQLDACGVCNGPGPIYDCGCTAIPPTDCDCNGAQDDALGVCGGDCTADADGDGICDDVDDCVGEVDECGICNGPGATGNCGCDDIPDGDCDCDGNELDAVGECGGTCTADVDEDGICDDVDPCLGAPALVAVSPSNGLFCAGGDLIALSGSNLCDATLTVDGASVAVTSSTPSQVNFAMPPGAGSAAVVVTTPSGTSNSLTLSYAAPVLAAGSPAAGLSCVGGDLIALSGSNLCDATLTVNGASVSVTSSTPSQVNFAMPPGAGSAAVVVTTPSGTSNSLTLSYAAPVLAAGSPAAGLSCVGGDLIALSGSNLCDATLTVNGASVSVTSSTPSQVNFAMPPGAGSVDAVVITPSGTSNALTLSYAAPVLTAGSPAEGLACAGGELVALSGSNLCDATLTVDGASVPVTSSTPSQVNFAMPSGSGSVVAVVSTPSGTSNALTLEYGAGVCSDPTACNFDGAAACGGGECLYEDVIGECGGDCSADDNDNGICDDVEGSGCADEAACNYDPFAEPVDPEPITDYCLLTEAVAVHDSGDLAGMTTYQVSIQTMNEADFVTSVSGNIAAPTMVQTTTSFFQHILGGATPQNVNPLLLPNFAELAFDSWVTIGLDGPADAVAGENAASIVQSPNQSWSLGFDPGGGSPGGDIVIDDEVGGVWYILNGDANGFPDENGRVLLGQFTTSGTLSGNMQVQVFPNGDNENFLLLDLPLGMGVGCPSGGGDNCLYDDALGECGGECTADADEDGICDDVDPCVGTIDACGICNGPGAIYDCGCEGYADGACDCDGNQEDALGVCGGDCAADGDNDGICDNVDDCVGQLDECGICNGPGATGDCGCDDIVEGTCDCDGNVLDAIGECGGDCTADVDGDGICDNVDDCVGDYDACGVCNGPGAIYDCECEDLPDGDCDCDGNQEDAIGVCGGDCAADVNDNGICDDIEEAGCDDPEACNYDENSLPYSPPAVDEGYCVELRTIQEHEEGELDGFTTYQVLLHTEHPTDFVTSVYGNSVEPLAIQTTTSFYQHFLGGQTPENVNPLLLPVYPNLAFDSWITIGLDGPANASFGENAASTVQSPDQAWVTLFEPGGGAAGGDIVMDDEVGGVWYILNGDVNGLPAPDGTVLLGQFTTDGDLSGNINIQVFPQGDNTDFLKLNLPIGGNCVADGTNPACTYPPGEDQDCDGTCINDADEDGICDEQEVAGCQDQNACNYNEDATDDDGSCLQLDVCGECGGDGIPVGDCDCDGNQLDALDVCGGDCTADEDSDGICDDVDPCVGELDACGVCNGPGEVYECGCADIPAGDCDCDGNQDDAVGVCGGDCTADLDEDGICDDVDPCVGALDACGICNGPGEVYDCGCSDIPAGDCDCDGNQDDAVGVCGGDCAADVDLDGICDDVDPCVGSLDACGVCNGPGAVYDCGCADIPAGDCDCDGSQEDAIGACGGDCQADVDADGICDDVDPCVGELDACGVCNGPGAIYDCGCADIPDGDCDCDGNQLDAVGVCGGDCLGDSDGDGVCDTDEVPGCTNPASCNYDPNATDENGSCEVEDALGVCGGDCPADLNGDGVCDTDNVFGCTEPSACNYNASADVNNGSCEFFSCLGCTDEDAVNYSPTATQNDGSCLFDGCTNSAADNYDPNADLDDGSCEIYGCTDATACNYDPLANANDGSCDFSCYGCINLSACNFDDNATVDDGSCEFVSCRGCTDPDAANYDDTALIDDNSCLYEGCTNPDASNYDAGADLNDGSCEFPGCTNPQACNFDSGATVDDGSCDLTSCFGCLNSLACNYDSLATIPSGDCDLLSCRGCTDPDAFNYDSDATIDNNSCLFLGCIDPEADNYDPNADYSDGSCFYLGCTNQFACNFDIDATVDDGLCDTASCYGCTNPLACNYDSTATTSNGSCDLFSCRGCTNPDAVNYDATATIDNGSCVVVGCQDENADNYNPDATYNDPSLCTYSVVEGCLILQACNYNPDATQSDGSCDFDCYGCTDPSANNYNSTSTLDDGSCTYGMPPGNVMFMTGCTLPFACNFGDAENPCEFDSCAGCLEEGACNYDPEATLATTCFEPQDLCNGATNVDCDCNCLNDANSNGICDEEETGGCTNPLSCNYNAQAAFDDGSCDTTSCAGCTDATACNYDAEATLNDNSCDYQTCTGCTDSTACNYDESATVADGSCDFAQDNLDCNGTCLNDVNENGICDEEETEGCTNTFACNFDQDATIDDGSCESESCAGCTDNVACNYDSEAIINDQSCEYESCLGCTQSDACNYNSGASQDDGSCIFPASEYLDCNGDCLQDVNQNGVCDPLEVPGCTNSDACNYDSEATDDDGSCDFVSCQGCLDASACNYDALATQSDGSCDYASCVGCTDSGACNYDPSATQSGGGCTYPVGLLYDCNGECVNDSDGDGLCDELEVEGCTDSGACNYQSLATNDNGSCEFSSCAGCTIPAACNYDANATQDDGSCDLASCLGCTYADALNYDASATIDDGGCLYDCNGGGGDSCPADLTGDDVVGVADLLEFLIYFDTSCIID